jgi:hypothetical protein
MLRYDVDFEPLQTQGAAPIVPPHITVTETVLFVLITVDDPAVARTEVTGDTKPWADQLAHAVVKMEGEWEDPAGNPVGYRWAFDYPKHLSEGSRFSTDSSAYAPWMRSWTSRFDGMIRGGKLQWLGFKFRQASDGRVIVLDGRSWFNGGCWRGHEQGGD